MSHPDDHAGIRLWNELPIGAHERAAKLPNAVYCVCDDSPWCTGPTGPNWLDCDPGCKGCRPKRRRPAVNTREGEHAQAD